MKKIISTALIAIFATLTASAYDSIKSSSGANLKSGHNICISSQWGRYQNHHTGCKLYEVEKIRIFFNEDSHTLSLEQRKKLHHLTHRLHHKDIAGLAVHGFADHVGSYYNNLDLAEDRALTVYNNLESGLELYDTHIHVKGMGSKLSHESCNHLSGTFLSKCLAAHRRVDVAIEWRDELSQD